jgi:hypothetical protein
MVRIAAEHEAELERVRSGRAAAEQEAGHRAAELRGELDTAHERAERLETAVRKARDEFAVARADLAAHREGLERERAAIAAEASKAAAEEKERLHAERDAAHRETDNARAERDAARRESANARGERDAAIRDRDRARRERQVLLSRVRSEGEKRRGVHAASSVHETTPAIPAEPTVAPRPPLPSARSAEGDWPEPSGNGTLMPARIAAVAALIVLAAVLVLVLSWAL